MGRGATSRSRDQYEPVEERKSRCRCNCFYGFLVFLTVVVLLGVVGGAGFAGWLMYNLRPGDDNGTYTYDVDVNGTGNDYPEPEDVSGGDIQYSRIQPYDPSKEKDDGEEDSPGNTTMAAPPATLVASTLGTAGRLGGVDAHISDGDLLKVSSSLWEASRPGLLEESRSYELRLGQQVNESVKADLSPDRLFSVTADLRAQSPTYTTFLRLLDNYNYILRVPETYNDADNREISDFLDAVIASPTMERLHDFLIEKGLSSSDSAAFKQQLWEMWFRLYNRSPKYPTLDSSGFERVFVGEIRNNRVIGLHNWIQFYLQETAETVNYHGYYSHTTPHMMSVRLKWHEKTLKMTSFFVGTPPEYDLSVYTLCVLTRPGEQCAITVDGHRVTVYSLEVKHVEGVQVADAYLAI